MKCANFQSVVMSMEPEEVALLIVESVKNALKAIRICFIPLEPQNQWTGSRCVDGIK